MTTTKTIDLSQLTALERGRQMVLLILTETGDVSQVWTAIKDQFDFLAKLCSTEGSMKAMKKMKIEKDVAGNVIGAVASETSQFMEQSALITGMLAMWSDVLDLSFEAKAAA